MLLSKKELRYIFSPTTKPISKSTLRRKFFTDKMLSEIGMTLCEYKSIKVFSFLETQRIIKAFDLSEELKERKEDRNRTKSSNKAPQRITP